jgi:hypothetical protein
VPERDWEEEAAKSSTVLKSILVIGANFMDKRLRYEFFNEADEATNRRMDMRHEPARLA